MKTWILSLAACALMCAASRAAVVELTDSDNREYGARGNRFFNTTANGAGSAGWMELRSTSSATARFDDVLDVGALVGVAVTQRVSAPAQRVRSFQTVGPPNFPNPAPMTTVIFREVLTLNSFVMSDEIRLASSTTAPIEYTGGTTFRINPLVSLTFPESFSVTGVYQVVGPTQTVATPFSVRFLRSTPANVAKNFPISINVGANYPTTATINAGGYYINGFEAMYSPETTTVFEGMVDGVMFRAGLSPARMRAFAAAPEPPGAALATVMLVASCACARKKRLAPAD